MLEGHEQPVFAIAFSPNGLVLASGSEDCTVRLWNLSTRACLRILSSKGSASLVAFTPYGKTVAFRSAEYIYLIDVEMECPYGKIWMVSAGNRAAFSPMPTRYKQT